ncbi:MAG: glutamate racemase [Clostridia bacterium]|nr:glutamate racemase [Clostridia bacterium]
MIGVFDSGVGGLSAFLALARALPETDLAYYADSAHLPLGERSAEEIRALVLTGVCALEAMGATRVLLACGTASAVALSKCKETFTFPVYGILEAGCKAAAEASKNGRIAVIATPATIRSHAYGVGIRALRPEALVTELACPALVAAAETGDLSAVKAALSPLSGVQADTLILGCTHFPLLREAIGREIPTARLIDPAALTADHLVSLCREDPKKETGQRALFTTGDPLSFAKRAEALFGCRLCPMKL